MKSRLALCMVVATGACVAACAGNPLRLTEPRKLPASSSSPDITRIRDLGTAAIDARRPLDPAAGDGVAAIGEALLVEGDGFGRQPTVAIGGVPTDVLGRTETGGIVVRVPPGTPAGNQQVRVSTAGGVATAQLPIRRYAIVVEAESGEVDAYSVEPDAATPVTPVGAPLRAPGAALLAIASSGGAAYAVAPGADTTLTVLDLGARGGPALGMSLPVPLSNPVAVTSARTRPLLALASASGFLLLDTSDAQHPSRYTPFPLPDGVAKGAVTMAAFSPDGNFLALGVPQANQVLLYDLSAASLPSLAASVVVAKDALAPLLHDLAWKADGTVLYALLGPSAASEKMGPRDGAIVPLALSAQGAGNGALTSGAPIPLPPGAAPQRIAAIHGLPLGAGTAIALPPERPVAYVSSVDETVVPAAALALKTAAARGEAASLLDGSKAERDGLLKIAASGSTASLPIGVVDGGALALSPDDALAFELVCRREGESGKGEDAPLTALLASLFVIPTDGSAAPPPMPIGTLPPERFGPPCVVGSVAVQP